MDYGPVDFQIIIELALIGGWGFWEYRRRDVLHKKAIIDLRDGVEPAPEVQPNWGRVMTTALVSVVLLTTSAGGLFFVNKIGFQWGCWPFIFIAELVLLAILLSMTALRDAGILRKG